MKLYEPIVGGTDAGEADGIDVYPDPPDGERLKQRLSRISLKQWRLFHAVVDFGGFVGAANALHISQSSISHALAKLQDQLGIPLLTLKGRKAQITDAGKIMLERSKELVRHAVDVEELAENLRLGWEPEVRVAVAPNFPSDHLIAAFHKLSSLPKKVRLNVDEVNAEAIKQMLQDNTVDLAISTEMALGFAFKKLAEIEYVAVAYAGNTLLEAGKEIDDSALAGHYQVVLAGFDDGLAADSCSYASHGPRRWKVNSLDSAVEALRLGLGYAWLPRYRVRHWLADGSLRILPLKSGSSCIIPMYLIYGKSVSADSCSRRFAEALLSVVAGDKAQVLSAATRGKEAGIAASQRC